MKIFRSHIAKLLTNKDYQEKLSKYVHLNCTGELLRLDSLFFGRDDELKQMIRIHLKMSGMAYVAS